MSSEAPSMEELMREYEAQLKPTPIGDLEVAASVLSNLALHIPAGLSGILDLLVGRDINTTASRIDTILDWGYTPRTEAGIETMQAFAEHPVISGLNKVSEVGGDLGYRAFDAVGLDPAFGGMLGELAPDLLDIAFGSHGGGAASNAIFAGMKADTAPRNAMSKAIRGNLAREDPRQIFKETGIHRGADNRMRYEIDDSQSRVLLDEDQWTDVQLALQSRKTPDQHRRVENIDMSDIFGSRGYRNTVVTELQSILDHPELYRAYPEMRTYEVHLDPDVDYGAGSFNSNLELPGYPATIHLGMMDLFDPFQRDGTHYKVHPFSKSTLMHEIQHGVQSIEDFARGGSPVAFDIGNAHPHRGQPVKVYQHPSEIYQMGDNTVWLPHDWDRRMYNALAGEAEARLVQHRLLDDPWQRRANYPVTDYDEIGMPIDLQYVLEGGLDRLSKPRLQELFRRYPGETLPPYEWAPWNNQPPRGLMDLFDSMPEGHVIPVY